MILSQKGWIRAAKGHVPLDQEFKYKEGDALAFILHAQTTDKLLLAASDGRFFTIGCDKGGGCPAHAALASRCATMIDLESEASIASMMVHRPGGRLLLASSHGKGFVAHTDELLAETRKGRQEW